ncbi:MAG: hypothetical protein HXX08_15715 [Chloroflexi bacterium]|uniref:Uncharacterized protein n=1 Tax=Candidatus Chlorohelix allophototropha TaxID=3003348 RepID=A0A8T7M5K0_9CHLR|nr:hypothetical protein [Chloroflexota bacterium]WJW69224.1 hypothetical protein OZ401_002824 [Chloroflexota bacterium L227-S17]
MERQILEAWKRKTRSSVGDISLSAEIASAERVLDYLKQLGVFPSIGLNLPIKTFLEIDPKKA